MKSVKKMSQASNAILSDYQQYLCGNDNNWFTITHKHNWDGGFICKNGDYYKRKDFINDLDEMMNVFFRITNEFNFEKVNVFPVNKNIFEHWSDVMSHRITKRILNKISNGKIHLEDNQGFEVDINDGIVKDIIYASFNYLVDCILLFNDSFAIIPTHNFEFRIYTPCLKSQIEIIVSDYEYIHVYE